MIDEKQILYEDHAMGFCGWADVNKRNKIYHDTEWGVPVHDDKKMFEHLMLECMQCGLSWDLMLKSVKSSDYVLMALIMTRSPSTLMLT